MGLMVMPLVAMGLQVGKSIFDSVQAGKDRANAASLNAQIPQEDPGVRSFLNDIRERRRYADAGQTRMMALQRRASERTLAQTGANIRRMSGTAPGGTQQGLLRSQQIAQQGLSQAGAGADQMGLQLTAMQGPLISDMADRKMSMQAYLRDQAAFQGAMRQQSANNAFSGALGLASMLSLQGGGGVGTEKAVQDTVAPQTIQSLAPPVNMNEFMPQGAVPMREWAQYGK